jgi:hypothetical protein
MIFNNNIDLSRRRVGRELCQGINHGILDFFFGAVTESIHPDGVAA